MKPNAGSGPLVAANPSEAERRTDDPPLWVRGEMVLYRLFDVGYEIDLDQAFQQLASSSPERLRPARGEAQAIRIANPPVTVHLGRTSLAVAGYPLELELADWCGAINAAPDWAGPFERWRAALVDRMRPTIHRPAVASVAEDYTVFRLSGLEDDAGRAVPIRALGE